MKSIPRLSLFLVLLGVFMISGCGDKIYKNHGYSSSEVSFPWGAVKAWVLGKNKQLDEKTVVVGPPYKLAVELKTYENASECTVSLDAVELISSDGKTINLSSGLSKDEEFKPDVSRSKVSKFFDRREYFSATFLFEELKLDRDYYELKANLIVKGNCQNIKDGKFSLLLKRQYSETTNSIWFQ